MTSPAAAAMRIELVNALAVLGPQITGMQSLVNDALQPATLDALRQEITDHIRRRDLCQAVIGTLDNLEADGWPDMPLAEVSAEVIAELQRQLAAITAAIAEFEVIPPASNISVDLGTPSDKIDG